MNFFFTAWRLLLLGLSLSLLIAETGGARPAYSGPPVLADDFSRQSLAAAVDRSLDYLTRTPPDRDVRLCGRVYTAAWLAESLREFRGLLYTARTRADLDRRLREQFDICPANGNKEFLVTGYFEPVFQASLVKKAPYLYPLYRVPSDLAVRVAGSDFSGRRIGRLVGSRLLPYWSRAEIENMGVLAGRELVWLKDPIEAFLLHVQGSGRVRLPDGSVRRVQYAAKNGRPYRSIGRLLVEEGKLGLEKASLPAIVRYLRDHPADRRRILHYNESFVFFRWGDDRENGPLGSLGEALTAGRSVALDQSSYPAAALGYLVTSRPRLDKRGEVSGWIPMTRFVLNQDSGSAIRGPGRLDFFWGAGPYARIAAGLARHPGRLYFLIKKK